VVVKWWSAFNSANAISDVKDGITAFDHSAPLLLKEEDSIGEGGVYYVSCILYHRRFK
jgi:hypothetical protein